MDMLDAELTYLDTEIQRINNEINYTMQDVVNSTPRINVPGMRRRHDRRTSIDTASASDVYVPLPTSIRVPRSARQIRSIGGADRAPSPRHIGSRSSPVTDPPQSVPRPKNLMKPATYDGTGLWNDYLSHFESVSLINHWTDLEKGLYLAASLRGQAQGVLGNQATGDRQNYQKLVQALQDRFAPSNQTELYRAHLRERRQKASETLPEMGQDIRRLTNLAYPTASSELKEVLATEQFLDGLFDPEMRLKIKQARPVNLNDAIQRAVELEAFNRAERRRKENVHDIDKDSSEKGSRLETWMTEIQKSLGLLQQEMQSLKQGQSQGQGRDGPTRRYNNRDGDRGSGSLDQKRGPGNGPVNRDRRCYNCHSLGHIARDCPNRKDEDDTEASHKQCHENKFEECSRNIHTIKEHGLYVKALIGGMETSLLIDTGATISLLSRVLFEALLKEKSYELKGVCEPIFSANGTRIDVIGQTEVCMAIDESKLQHSLVIADIRVDGILGMDFLKKHNCVINLQKGTLSVSGIEHLVVKSDGLSKQHKVSAVSRHSLPSGPFVNVSDGNTNGSDAAVVRTTLTEKQSIVPSKQALRGRRRRHRKMTKKIMYQKHECTVGSDVTETLDKERIGDGGGKSNLDPDVWTHNIGSLDATTDKGLARIPSSLSKTTDVVSMVGYIMRKTMQLCTSVKTRQSDREADDRTQNSVSVEGDRSVARLWRNGSKTETQPKITEDMSGSEGLGLKSVEDLAAASLRKRNRSLVDWLQDFVETRT